MAFPTGTAGEVAPPPACSPERSLLAVEHMTTTYGIITGLRDASLRIGAGEIVAVVGPNGAGKSTLLASIVGLVRPAAGRVLLDGRDVTGWAPDRLLRRGVALVPERRRIFTDLSVLENLLLGGAVLRPATRRARVAELLELFPVLAAKRAEPAGYLSGGEAQQLAIARALMSRPRLLLLDEPSLGLAPTLVDLVFDLIARLRAEGRTILVVEQNVRRVLALADRGYVLRSGRVTDTGTGAALAERGDLFAAYLGEPG